MEFKKEDFKIFNKFDFELPPIGIKYLFKKPPKDIPKYEGKVNICEAPFQATKGEAFYVSLSEFSCVGPIILGMIEKDAVYEAGLMGQKYEIFDEPRTNRKLYQYAPRFPKGSIRYVLFAPLDKMTFNPDILFVHADGQQARILMRASGYSNTKIWSAKAAAALTCSYMFVQPIQQNEINFAVSPVGMGGKVYPDGTWLISFPYETFPHLIWSLENMNWTTGWDKLTPKEHQKYMDKVNAEVEDETGVKVKVAGEK